MKNGKTEHYWRIHKKVATRLLSELSEWERHVIASDREHTTALYQWVEKRIADDAERLYADKDYYANAAWTFRYPQW
jgi:hypothetical protein